MNYLLTTSGCFFARIILGELLVRALDARESREKENITFVVVLKDSSGCKIRFYQAA